MRTHNPLWLFISLVALIRPAFEANAYIDATLQMQLGNPSGAGTDTNNHDHYLIQRTVEAMDYSDNYGEPVWVSWDLTSGDIGGSGRSPDFFTDPTLPSDFYAVTPDDYDGVGNIDFNRGHMCPSEDRTDNTADNKLVFYMSNIIPQAANANDGPWASLESYCRTLADAGNELLIYCGPEGFGAGTRIPSGKAVIPDYTWKIVVVVPLGNGTALSRVTATNRVIAVKIPNNNSVSSSWQDYVTSVGQIESETGYTFFTALPPDVAAALRHEVDGLTTLFGWDMSGVNNYGVTPMAPTTNSPGLNVTGLTRGPGVGTSGTGAQGGWGGNTFTSTSEAGAIAASQFISFGAEETNSGYTVSYLSISALNYRRSGSGPTNGVVQYQVGSGAFNDISSLFYSSSSGNGASLGPIDLSDVTALQNVPAGTNVTFRIVNYNGTSPAGTWYIFDVGSSPRLDFEVQGLVAPVVYPPANVPSFSPLSFLSNQVRFMINGTAGSNYVVQVSTNLAAPEWMSVETNIAPFIFTETNGFPQRFYRAEVAP
ncbi:MAG TPA: DNA/RNA non-specific endonuclease [Verrucomicrobiae bacterium]|jgi:endonuclease G